MSTIKKLVPVSLKKAYRKYKLKPKYDELTISQFKGTDSNSKRLILIGAPNYGNLGDHAIVEAGEQFIKEYFPNVTYIEISMHQYRYSLSKIKEFISKNDIILVPGGGFLGALWPEGEEMFLSILESFPDNNVIVFPQTVYFDDLHSRIFEKSKAAYEKHKNLTFFVRDQASFNLLTGNKFNNLNVNLVPDIVTFLEPALESKERENILFCLRTDKEKVADDSLFSDIESWFKNKGELVSYTDTVIDDFPTSETRKTYLYDKLMQFRQSKLVITDRLHGMIFALISGTPCIAFDNASKKVSGVYEWIKDCGYIYMLDDSNTGEFNQNIDTILNDLLNSAKDHYKNDLVIQNFEPLIDVLDKQLS